MIITFKSLLKKVWSKIDLLFITKSPKIDHDQELLSFLQSTTWHRKIYEKRIGTHRYDYQITSDNGFIINKTVVYPVEQELTRICAYSESSSHSGLVRTDALTWYFLLDSSTEEVICSYKEKSNNINGLFNPLAKIINPIMMEIDRTENKDLIRLEQILTQRREENYFSLDQISLDIRYNLVRVSTVLGMLLSYSLMFK